MSTKDRQKNEGKPTIRLKTLGDMNPWFPTPHSPSRTVVDASQTAPGASAFGEAHSVSLGTDNDLMFNFGRFVARAFTRLLQMSRLELLFFSYLLFSLYVFGRAITAPRTECSTCSQTPDIPISSQVARLSPMQDLPTDFLMTKLTSLYPTPVSLKPYVTRANTEPGSVTACLWTQDADIRMIPTWASRWKGPMSVLITTYHPPNSSETQELLEKITAFRQVSATKYRLSAHVLHLAPGTPDNPNAFLNLARALARTPTVALFPGNLSFVPPKSFQRSISSSSSSSQHKAVVFTVHGQTAYPFTALSPVLVGRDSPVWCTERFFPTLSRSAEWTECLWQFWLETYGSLETRLTTDWLDGLQPTHNASSIEAKVHRRLSTKFRSETCTLATRQTAAARTVEHGVDMRKLRWLKRHCRPWIAGRDRD